MCGRASLTKQQKELEQRFQAEFYQEDIERYNPLPSYNIAPTHIHPVITSANPDHFQAFKWGLIPHWAKEATIGSKMINARIETILEKPAFKNAISLRRCLIPFDGFYEWKKIPSDKIPYRITLNDQGLFAVAGIWEQWDAPNGETIFSFSVITQSSNDLMKNIHDRMPAILLPDQEKHWIDKNLSAEEALSLITSYPSELMNAYTISSRINKVSQNDLHLLEEIPFDRPIQGSLF
ncbi:MAG: putative SOS response-associated peptidase YedK [Saprospiraceae bacterium]|jgi:putative SOS response-associated peptidase YedK